jgi:hypothetical protein
LTFEQVKASLLTLASRAREPDDGMEKLWVRKNWCR